MWQTVSSGGLQGWLLWEEAGAAPCGTQPAPTDPPQSTAEPLSQAGDTSGKTCFRKGTPKSEKKGGGTALVAEQISPAAHGRAHIRADIPCSLWRTPRGAQGYSWRNCSPRRTHTRVETRCEEEGVAERYHYVLTATPLPSSMWACRAGVGCVVWGVWSEGTKLSLGEEGGKVCCFNVWVCFSLPESILIGNKLANFPQVESVLPEMVIGKQLPCYLNLLLYCFCFSYFIPLPYQSEEGVGASKQPSGNLAVSEL